jgi:ADP-heptose:LPS heptosyltransferase
VPSEGIVCASQVIPNDLCDGYLSYQNQPDKKNKIPVVYRLWRKLRKERFDAAVYLVVSERPARSIRRDKIFFRVCGIRRLIGFHSFAQKELYPIDDEGRPAMTSHEAARKLKRLKLDGIETAPEDLRLPLFSFSRAKIQKIKNWLAARRKKTATRLIAIAPGCKMIANIWSSENFIALGRKLIESADAELIVVGGEAERETGERMIKAWGEGINAAGSFSVHESAALLSLCDFYIGLDTGTTHLAAAVGTRCLGIYGERNNSGHWYPLGKGHTIVYHPVKCAGCRLFICPLEDHPCMSGISVDFVWQNLQELMARHDDGNNAFPIETEAV